MRIATATSLMGYDISIIDKMYLLHEAGFRALDLGLFECIGEGAPIETPWYKEWAYKLKQVADELGMTFCQCHSPIYDYYNADERTKFLNELSIRSLEVCGILDIPWCVFHVTNIPEGNYEGEHKAIIRETNIKHFKTLCDTAAEHGTGICCENLCHFQNPHGLDRMYHTNADEILDFVDAVAKDNLGICLDTGHAHIMGCDIPEMIRKFGSKLVATHIHDSIPPVDAHLAPFMAISIGRA